jgi:hypothetical protein
VTDWLNADGLSPHGFCLSWDPTLMAAVVFGNAVISASYLFLAVILVLAALAPRPAVPRWLYWSFAAFIFCCGVSHVLDDVTLWYPVYRIQAAVLCVTALVSVFAAVMPITVWVSHEAERWRR